MTTVLPERYLTEMKELLGDEYDAYLASFDQPHYTGLRVNTLKISVEDFLAKFPYHLEPVPWCSNGFYYNSEDPVTHHPYYYAGLYYIQEPSAMLPANVLPIAEGDRVLDVCAAPGGKSTELGSKLRGTGVLFSNDISVSRSQALLKNIERFGIRNAFVLSNDLVKFAPQFEGYFDKILVDAPCSGEGMFRKEHSLIGAWEERDSLAYVPIQKSIVEAALRMLKDGGQMVYSTCTFSKCEDEEIIAYAKELCPDLKVIPLPYTEGFVQNEYGTKLYPHRIHGEGHFVTLLQKGEAPVKTEAANTREVFDFDSIHMVFDNASIETIKDRRYAVPQAEADTRGLRIMRSGILLGEDKKNRFEPDGAIAMYLKEGEYDNVLNFTVDDPRVMKYLKGETLNISDCTCKDGYAVVAVDGYPLGLAKVTKGLFKNKYPKAWIAK